MDNLNLTRRGFVKGLSSGALYLACTSSLGVLAGCSAPLTSKQSYIHDFMKPQNLTAAYHWTDVALQAIRNQTVTPPPASRALAMGHLAGFLAVNGIEGGYNTQWNVLPAPKGANPEVAYGVAMSRALSEAFQTSFAFDRKRFLSAYPDGEAKERGIKYGEYVSDLVIERRTNDGAEPNKANFYLGRYPRRNDSLRWAPTGPFYGADDGPFLGTYHRGLLPGWGAQKPWVMKNKGDFRAPVFLDVNSPEFVEEYRYIKAIGGDKSTLRTTDQTQIAFFWEDGPRGVTPPGHWQIIAMRVTQDMGLPLLEQARLMALLSLGQADAAITTWDSKYAHDIVRPETVIKRRADDMGNPELVGQGDSDWLSLIFTPDFPAYTSGHSTFSGVSARMIANFIGTDRVAFSAQAPDLVNWPKQLTDVRRSWTSLWQAAEENGLSRIYGGVHWNADNDQGLRIGRNLADYIYRNAFVKAV